MACGGIEAAEDGRAKQNGKPDSKTCPATCGEEGHPLVWICPGTPGARCGGHGVLQAGCSGQLSR